MTRIAQNARSLMLASMSTYENPYSTSTRWLRGNLHAHTCCSGFMDIAESGPMFASLGYDFLAVTDHNQAPDEQQWRQWQQQAGLLLVPGEENGADGHMLEIGVHEVTPTPSKVFAERAAALRGGGGFVMACHPQEYPENGAENIFSAAADLHAVEVFNGLRESIGCDETANIPLWDELLTAGKRLWACANDDFHFALITPGHGWVCVQVPEDEDEVTWQMVVAQLKAGAFFASTYPRFEQITLDEETLRVSAGRRAQLLRVIGPGGRTLHEQQGPQLEWQTEPDLSYFRIEAHTGVKRAWSQPFFAV